MTRPDKHAISGGSMFALPRPLIARTARWLGTFRGPWRPRELALLLTVCPLLVATGALLSERVRMRGYVMPGVQIDGEPVSGLAEDVLRQRLVERHERMSAHSQLVRVGQQQFRIVGDELGARLAVDAAVSAAMRAGREGSPLAQLSWRIARWSRPWRLDTELALDSELLDARLTHLEERALSTPQEAGLHYDGKRLVRTEPRPGQVIARDSAHAALRQALTEGRAQPLVLELADVAPQTTVQQLEAVVSQADHLLAGPLTMEIKPPRGSSPLTRQAERAGSEPGDGASPWLLRIEPESLRPAVHAQVVDGELRLSLEGEAFEAALKPLRARFEQPAQDARFDVDRAGKITISPSKVQTRLTSADAARSLLLAAQGPERRGTLEIVEAEAPRITTELAQSLNITRLVGQFTTHHPCCRPRVQNIHRMADSIDGTVVLPGETFSINEHVGPRTPAKGFVPAPTIVRGEIDDTSGGGVSQFATTIFNAVLDAGYEIIERQPHSYYFSRYPVGHEATLSYPKPDFIFRNDTSSGVLIKAEYGATYIRVKIYGDNEGRKVRREVSERFDFIEPKLVYEVDDTLLPDEAVVKEAGERGFSVNVSRIVTLADGTQRTEARKVIYNPRDRVVAVHSCVIPEGESGYTGEECPEPELIDAGASAELGPP